jgi:glutaredoxin
MRIYIALAAAFILHSVVQADVYKWKDEHGRVQFGDRPPAGSASQKMTIRSYSEPEETTTEKDVPKATGVVMYSTAWCVVCRQARAYMISKGIPFTEYDVEKSETGRAAYKKLKGTGVPIIMVGDQRMNGFSASRFEEMIGQSRAPGAEPVSVPAGTDEKGKEQEPARRLPKPNRAAPRGEE